MKEKTIYCKACKVDVVPVVKVFNTCICPKCNVILSSDKGIAKGSR